MGHGEHTSEFRYHHPNTQQPRNEQAGIAALEQPLATRVIGSLLNKHKEPLKCRIQTRSTQSRILRPNTMAKNRSIQRPRQPTPSLAAFKQLPLLTATTRRNRLKTQSFLLRNFQARSRSIG